MKIAIYILRSVKYLTKLVLLLAVVFALMRLSGTSNIESSACGEGIWGFLKCFISTVRGQIFAVAVVVWCAVYPAVEFRRRSLNYGMGANKAAIINALSAGGMTLTSDDGGRMVFSGSTFRRIWWLGDDAVTITAGNEGGIEIEGPRRFVMEAQHRIPTYINAQHENE